MLRVMEESKTYIIYKHVSPSGKVYIGQTNQIPELRFRNGEGYRSSKKFYNAILKYGWKNFKHEIGFKELSWSKKELDEFVKKCRINQRLRSNPKSEIA